MINQKIKMMKTMHKFYWMIAAVVLSVTTASAQNGSDPLAAGLGGVATVVGETQTVNDSVLAAPAEEIPLWKQKLYYGYNFDIYYHHDSRTSRKENGWSVTVEPEIGWRLKERVYLGLRLGGSYQDTYTTYSYENLLGQTVSEDLRVRQGSWNVTPYVRYRMKTLFNEKVGIWLEAHLYGGMDFPSVASGSAAGTDYEGLRYKAVYGVQVSPVITYQFTRKRSFQIFFSILSLGYSGTTYFYEKENVWTGEMERYNEYTNDVIVFSGKLKNLLASHFTPGMYGLKFGIQKSF